MTSQPCVQVLLRVPSTRLNKWAGWGSGRSCALENKKNENGIKYLLKGCYTAMRVEVASSWTGHQLKLTLSSEGIDLSGVSTSASGTKPCFFTANVLHFLTISVSLNGSLDLQICFAVSFSPSLLWVCPLIWKALHVSFLHQPLALKH